MLGFYVLFYKYLNKNIYKLFSLAFNKYASEKLTWCYPAKSDICKWIPLVLRWQMTEGIYCLSNETVLRIQLPYQIFHYWHKYKSIIFIINKNFILYENI